MICQARWMRIIRVRSLLALCKQKSERDGKDIYCRNEGLVV